MEEQVINRNFDEYISFLKEKCDFFNRISYDTDYLYSEINNLKNTQQLDTILDVYNNPTGSANILRLFILKCVKYGKTINEQLIQEAKDNFNQKNIKFFQEYLDSNTLERIGSYTTKNGGDPFRNWKNPFSIFYVYFYDDKLKKIIKDYLNKIGNELIRVLNLNDYTFKAIGFEGCQGYGQSHIGIYAYPERLNDYKNTIQIFCEINNTQLLAGIYKGSKVSNNITIDEETRSNEYDNFESAIQGLEDQKDIAVKLNNSLDGNEVEKTRYWMFSKEFNMDVNIPLNQILYGPPGTGKTYNTVLKAMSIIDNVEYKDVSSEQYSELKNRFDQLKQAGQIEFVTFHQSYSYEEFVEGIKPNLDSENLSYQLENGIFKQICNKAIKRETTNFDEVYSQFLDEVIEYENENSEPFTLKTSKNKTFGIEVNPNKNLRLLIGKDLKPWGTLTKTNLENIADWKYYAQPIYEYLKKKYNLNTQKADNTRPYILIIDEINRGDVSKIFGELITLIEEDKRIGNKYQMKTTLPYSKEPFGVPNNLYIIGTMNTADRSIALLDTALRRRFDFEEIMPRPELLAGKVVAGINLEQLLKRINQRITEEYDRDHQIGHSYLMGVETEKDLERAYKNRILPLLNEYFYNDTKTVSQILNCSENELQNNFLDVLNKAQNS